MSQENVDLVRASFDAWDEGGVTAWAALLAPDVVWRFPLGWPKPGPYFGRDNVLRVLQQQRDTWDFSDTADPTVSYLDAGNRVVVRFVWGDGEQGSDLDLDVTCVFNVRDRRISEAEFFWDHAEALEAVGLSE